MALFKVDTYGCITPPPTNSNKMALNLKRIYIQSESIPTPTIIMSTTKTTTTTTVVSLSSNNNRFHVKCYSCHCVIRLTLKRFQLDHYHRYHHQQNKHNRQTKLQSIFKQPSSLNSSSTFVEIDFTEFYPSLLTSIQFVYLDCPLICEHPQPSLSNVICEQHHFPPLNLIIICEFLFFLLLVLLTISNFLIKLFYLNQNNQINFQVVLKMCYILSNIFWNSE